MTQPVRMIAWGVALLLCGLASSSSAPAHETSSPADDAAQAEARTPVRAVRIVSDAENPARQPFQEKKRILLPDGQCCDNAFVDVPAGKRLVIEYASASGFANGSQSFMYEVGTLVNNETAFTKNHFLPVVQQILDGNTVAIAGQEVRLYANPGPSRVMLRASRSGGGEATVFMTVSGHLVDLP